MKMPYLKWYYRDVQADSCLRMCSMEARGVWYELLWIMAGSTRHGYLVKSDGCPYSDDELCRLIGTDKDTLYRSKAELLAASVPGVDGDVWFNRRMVCDEARRVKAAEFGRKGGGNPALRHISEPPQTPPSDQNTEPRTQNPLSIKVPFIGASIGSIPEDGWPWEVVKKAATEPNVALRESEAREYFDTRTARGWIDAKGLKVAQTFNGLVSDLHKWKRNQGRSGHDGQRPAVPPRRPVTMEDIQCRISEKTKGAAHGHAVTPAAAQ